MNEKEKTILQKIKNSVQQKDPTAEIILFGSHARGQAHKNSDWDILILLNKANVNRIIEREYRDALFNVALETGEAISTFVFSKQVWNNEYVVTPLYQNIKKEGIYL